MSYQSSHTEWVGNLRICLSCGRADCACILPFKNMAALHCPVHDDQLNQPPTLSLKSQADGTMRIECEAGCSQADVTKTLQARGLWHQADVPMPKSQPVPQPRKSIAKRMIDLADVPPPSDIPILFGPYLVQGAAHWMTGQTGLGKSTFCYNLVCAIAEGTELWGIPCEPRNVMYLDLETGDEGRARKIERLYRNTPRVRGRLFFTSEPIKFADELDEFLAYVQENNIALVVFDTVRRCFRVKDENDNAEVYNQVVPVLDALKRKGVASLTIGHPCKNGGASARGAGAQEDAGDVNLTLTMHRGDVNDKNGIIALKVTKNRQLGLGIKSLYLQRSNTDDDRFHRVDVDEPADNSEEPGTRAECVAAIVRCVEEQQGIPISYTLLRKAMQEEEHKESTFKRALTQAMAGKLIAKAENGSYILPECTTG